MPCFTASPLFNQTVRREDDTVQEGIKVQPEGQGSLCLALWSVCGLGAGLDSRSLRPIPKGCGAGKRILPRPRQVIGIRAQHPGLCWLLGLRADSWFLKSTLLRPPRLCSCVLMHLQARTCAFTITCAACPWAPSSAHTTSSASSTEATTVPETQVPPPPPTPPQIRA